MSKIGNKPVVIQDGVEVDLDDRTVHVKGPKGELTVPIPHMITVEKTGTDVMVRRNSESKKVKSLHGLVRSLIANAINGVCQPWEKKLEVVGTGYRVKMVGKDLLFEVGYSHSVEFKERPGLVYAVDGNKIMVTGIDKQQVGEAAHKIKMIRKPDPYKGKGVRYEGEIIRLKPGKKAKTT